MTFSDFAKTLYPFCGNGRKNSDFILALTDNIIEIHADESVEPNPLYELQADALRRIFSGTRGITPQNASIILGRLDKGRFIEYLEQQSTDALSGICVALNENGIDANVQNICSVCADLFEQILKVCAENVKRRSKTYNEEFSDDLPANFAVAKIPNTPIASVYITDGKIHIGGTTIKLPDKLLPPAEVSNAEVGYVQKLFEAYSDAEKPKKVTHITLGKYPKYLRNFSEQREHYFNAIYVFERVRGVFAPSEGNHFDILKQETYNGISEVYYDDYENGYDRLTAVLKQAAVINVNKSMLCNIRNLIGISEVKGICHILVSDGTIPSWVIIYG